MPNKLEQLSELMRVSVAYVLGRSASPTPLDAPVDLDKLSADEVGRLEKIGAVTRYSIGELLGAEVKPPPDKPPKDPGSEEKPPPKPPKDFAELRTLTMNLVSVLKRGIAELDTGLDTISSDGIDPPPDPEPPTEDPDMPIIRPDFAHAHARVAIDGDRITVERSTGVDKESPRFATDSLEHNCDSDSSASTSHAITYAAGSDKLPKNAKLVRMRLTADHKIDPSEVVVLVTASDRESSYRHTLDGFAVSDGVVDVLIRDPEPDVERPKLQVRFDVVLLRVG